MSPNIWLFVRALRFQEGLDRARAGAAHPVVEEGARSAVVEHRS